MMSMTGYGSARCEADGRILTVEIKTVNHRFLDIACRMPKGFLYLEDTVRKELSSVIERGHADVFVTYENRRSDARRAVVDTSLALQYDQALQQLSEVLSVRKDAGVSFFASLPDVIVIENEDDDKDAVQDLLVRTLREAEKQLLEMRAREGSALLDDLNNHLRVLEGEIAGIAKIAPEVPAMYRDRLLKRLQELDVSNPDPQRIAQETAIMADRCAIDEELSRLNSHIGQMKTAFLADRPIGKRMDFLIQEFNREVNTIGSKASDARITKNVVAAKNEIEKMREQIQNVE